MYAAAPLRFQVGDALIEGDFKLIVSDGGETELYDLAQDPAERVDLSSEQPDVARSMRATLEVIRHENEERRRANRARLSEAERKETTEGTLEQLRALGYVD